MRDMDLENSIITKVMRDGPPDNDGVCYCPVCYAAADELAVNQEGEVVGCRECIEWKPAWTFDGIDE